MSAALRIRGLAAGYGASQVLHGIDLDLEPGERVGIIGLNGHGKTTLLRAVVGLVDWRRGEIELHGRSVTHVPPYRLAREGLVLIPQGDALFPGMTVKENLDAGAYMPAAWRQRATRRKRVLELFPRLAARLKQSAGTLSGGERRMLSVGRGLMADADVYLIDEPSLGLGPGIAQGLIDTLARLDLKGGAMLLAEQNRALVEGRIDRVVRIHGGRHFTDDGNGGELFAEPPPGER